MRIICGVCASMVVAACGGAPEQPPSVRMTIEAAPAQAHVPTAPTVIAQPLSELAQGKVDDIRAIVQRNSLARFSRLADGEPSFVSNFAGESNRAHWDLLRRTGFDPLAQIELLLDGPYATRTVGEELWYIWPDLAALDPAELVPERLSFTDRARLLELVGEAGIERVRRGQGYPGVRTAIAEDGRWLYFVHETEDESED